MEQSIEKQHMVPSIFLIIVIHTMQIGVGITTYARFVYLYAKQDAWISVILAGAATHIVMFVICKTMGRFKNMDLFSIHHDIFGKWLGNGLSLFYMIYVFGYGITYIINYYAFIGEYLMPDMPVWLIAVFLLTLAIYTVQGGIRVIVGVSILTFLLTFWLFFLMLPTIKYFEFLHFLPVLEAPPKQLLMGAFEMSFSLTGFEALYFIYPYVSNKEQVHRYGQMAMVLTNITYLFTTVLILGFYSGGSLMKTLWPTLNLYKSVGFPILEQFEIIVICLMMLIVLPNLAIVMWIVSKGIKKMTAIKQVHALYAVALIMFAVVFLFKTRIQIISYVEVLNAVTFFSSFLYPILLFGIVCIVQLVRRKRGVS